MPAYTESYKKKMVLRMTGSRALSASALSREINVPQSTLSSWLRKLGTVAPMSSDESNHTNPAPEPAASLPDPPATHRTRSPEDKLRLVAQAVALDEQQLGALLRREGIHAAELEQWRAEMLAALAPKSRSGAAEEATARPEDRRRIQQLEREVDRKDKALAEAAALLMLQKKVREYFGEEDDITKRGSGR